MAPEKQGERRRPAEPSAATRLSHLAFVGLGLGIFAWTLHGADLSQAKARIAGLGLLALLIVVPQGVWTFVHAAAWKRILAGLGQQVPLAGLSSAFFSSEAARLVFPAGPAVGESLSVYLLRTRYGVPVAEAVSSLATKKLLVVFTNALYAGLGIFVAWQTLRLASARLFGSDLLVGLMLAAMVALLGLALAMGYAMRHGSPATRLLALLRAIPVAGLRRRLDHQAERWAEADERLARPLAGRSLAPLASPATLMLVQWLLEALETWLILRLLGVEIGFGEALALEVAGSALRSLAFAIPAGLGVQDAGYVAMLGAFGVAGTPAVGVAFVLLKRSKELFWIGVGWILMLAAPRREPVPEVEQT